MGVAASHPEAVVDPALYHGLIRVRSEIYDASLTPRILSMLDEIGRGATAT